MFWRFCLILFIGVLLEWKLTHSAPATENGKTKEKVRAYEFGFSIEEQQHRHEKRDENGIVMGEFGFITADGIYHVTVYATDENGKFKIISMKNYPYGGSPEKKIMIARLPPAKMPVVTTTKQPTTIKSLVPDGSSCGGCVKPKKMNLLPADVKEKKPDDEKAVFRPLSKPLSNGKTNGEAVKVGKSTPTSKSAVGGNGKVTTGSKVPGSQPLVPPKVSTKGAQKSNGATSSKNGPGKNDKYDGPLINVRLDSDSLTPPKTSTPGAKAPTTGSKNGPGIKENDGNKYEIIKPLTQTTSTPTQILTQISKIQEPSINSRFDDEDLLLTKTRGTIPSKFLNALTTPNNKQIHNSESNNTNKIQNTLSKTTTTSSQITQNQNSGKATYPNSPTAITQGSTFSPTTERKASANKMILKPTIASSVGVPNDTKTTPTNTSLKDSLKKSALATPDSQFTNENNPTDFNTRFSEENTLTTISKMTGRNPTPSGIKTTATPSKPLQAIYNTELSLNPSNPTVQSFEPSTNQNIKTTPQQYTNTQTKTNPTRNFTQFPKNSENTVQNPLQNQIIPSSRETNFQPAGVNLKPQNSPNPSVIPTIPSKTKPQTVLNTTPTISSIYPNNPTKSFTVPTKNEITPQYQKGSTNTATQNTARPILKTTKEPKSFQTLSKVLPDEDNSIKNRIPQTSTLTTVPSKTTVLQKPGQVTSKPQLISKNTVTTQPQLTTQTLIPKRLQQNTNEAKTSTTNTQSTNKQTSAAPSKQSTGKTTSSTNPAAGLGGVGGASSSGSAAAGGSGGPLYKFNYVLDYNSHREEGRIDGSKEGNYNTIDEDGIRRIIDYIANENGYQPHIKLERLPPNEVPTGENKLKEYEFVWFN